MLNCAGVQIRECCASARHEGVWVTGSKSPCIPVLGDRQSWGFIFTPWLSFIFLSFRFYFLHFVSLSLTSFPLFLFTFKLHLCLSLSLFTLSFSTLFLLLCFFPIFSFRSLSWSFTFCVLVMTSAVTLSLKSSDTSFQSCRDHCLPWSMTYVIFFSPPFNISIRQLPLPSQSFPVHYPSITLSFQLYHLWYNQRR